MSSRLIELRDVTLGYDKRWLLGPVNLAVERGQFWVILGPNGSGKTTLLKTMLNLLPPLAGRVTSDKNGVTFGYVPQSKGFDHIFPVSVYEITSMGRYCRVPMGKRLSKEDKKIIESSLERVDIIHLKNRAFRSLSGGEKQRALLARAIVGEPDVLVLDEPTAFVDIKGEGRMMELVKNIQPDNNLAVLMVSHFLDVASGFADHIVLMDKENNFFQAGEKSKVLERNSLDKLFGVEQVMDRARNE